MTPSIALAKLKKEKGTPSFQLRLEAIVAILTRVTDAVTGKKSKRDNSDKDDGKVSNDTLKTVLKVAGVGAAALAFFLAQNSDAAPKPSETLTSTWDVSAKPKTKADEEAAAKKLDQDWPYEEPEPKKYQFNKDKMLKDAEAQIAKPKPVKTEKPKLSDQGYTPYESSVTRAVKRIMPSKKKGYTLDQLINKAAAAIGVSAPLLKAFVMLESSGTPNARSPTGALGLTQFTTIAWQEVSQKGGKAYGIEHPIPASIKGTAADPRFDPFKSLIAGAILMREGTKFLSERGIEPDAVALYTYHNVGPSTTLAVYGKAAHTKATRKAIASQGAGFNTSNYLKRMKAKVTLAQTDVRINPAFSKVVLSSDTSPVAVATPSVSLSASNTQLTPEGASEPIKLAQADMPEPSPQQPSNKESGSSMATGRSKPQEMFRDRNGHLVAA